MKIEKEHILIDGDSYDASVMQTIIVRPNNTSVSIVWKKEGPTLWENINEDQLETIIPELTEFAKRNNVDFIED